MLLQPLIHLELILQYQNRQQHVLNHLLVTRVDVQQHRDIPIRVLQIGDGGGEVFAFV